MGFYRMSILGTTQIAHKLEHNNLKPWSEISFSVSGDFSFGSLLSNVNSRNYTNSSQNQNIP